MVYIRFVEEILVLGTHAQTQAEKASAPGLLDDLTDLGRKLFVPHTFRDCLTDQ